MRKLHMQKTLRFGNERGQGMVEYLLIIALVVIAGFALWSQFGDNIQKMLEGTNAKLEKANEKLK